MAQDPYWPFFLDLFDVDPDAAWAEFYKYARIVITARPPQPLLGLNREDREDCIEEIIFHCIKDDFRVLRRYEDIGRPFSAWLYVIAHNKAVDFIEKRNRRWSIEIQPEEDTDVSASQREPVAPFGNPDGNGDLDELVEKVEELIRQLGEECRQLLELAGQGLKPKEIAKLLGLPEDQNKKVSDHLRYCRDKLKKLLAEEGYDLAAYLS